MGLGGFFRKQFIDVIQWTESEQGVLAYRFPMADMEIQNGAQLTVRESQAAVFVNEGRAADVFGPGRYTLDTKTLPLLTNLMNWDKLFQSPFKSDVYFFSTRQQTAQRWGTQNPLTIRDKDFGMVRLRAFGMYAWHIDDPVTFVQRMSGTREEYRVADLEPHLRNLVVSRMSEAFAGSGTPFLDMAANTGVAAEAIAAPTATVLAAMSRNGTWLCANASDMCVTTRFFRCGSTSVVRYTSRVPLNVSMNLTGSSTRQLYIPNARSRTIPKSLSRMVSGFCVPHRWLICRRVEKK